MRLSYLKMLFATILTLMGVASQAQQYPVQLISQLNSPVPLNLSLFNVSATPKVTISLTNRDLQGAPLKVKLKMIINGPGIQLITSNNAVLSPIILQNGLPTILTSADLAPYFNLNNLEFSGVLNKAAYQASGQLPEGAYSYCFEVWEYNTNKLLSYPFCSYAYCTLSEPPLLNEPLNKSTILFDDPATIFFSWTPRHNNNPDLASVGASYRFTLKELNDTLISPQVAYNSSNIIYSTIVTNSNLQYGLTLPSYVNLTSNKHYAWAVQVVSNDNFYQPSLRNGGNSEIYSFQYKKDCTPPQFKSANPIGRLMEISWEQNRYVKDYELRYAEKNVDVWETKTIVNGKTESILDDISLGKVYKYNVGTICDATTVFGEQDYFVVPPPPVATKNGIVKWAMNNRMPNTPLNLIGGTYTTPISTTISESVAGENSSNNSLPLPNVKVTVFKDAEPIAITYTDEQGRFTIDIDTAAMLNDRRSSFKMKVTATDNISDFKVSNFEYNLSGKRNGEEILNTIQDNITLYVKSFVFRPQIHAADRQHITPGSMGGRVDVYLPLTVWMDSYGRLNKNISPNVYNYDGVPFVKVGSVNDQNKYLNLMMSSTLHSVMTRVVINNTNELSKIVKPILGNYWSNVILTSSTINSNYEGKVFNTHVQFDPTVTFYGKIWRDPNKNEGLSNGVIEFKDISYNTLASSTADNEGVYSLTIVSSLIDPFAFLYASRMDNAIKRSINSDNFEYPDSTINHNSINYDMVLPPISGKIRFVYGKILDPNGFLFNTAGEILFNNKRIGNISRGYYYVKLEDGDKIEDSLTFNVPDFQKVPVYDSIVNLPVNNWYATFKERLGTNITNPLFIDNEKEELVGVTHANVSLPYGRQIIFTPEFNKAPVNVKLRIKNLTTNLEQTFTNKNPKKIFVFKGDFGSYEYQVIADSTSPNFLPFSGTFAVDGESHNIIMKLQPATNITGKVVDKGNNKKIDSVYLDFMGMEYKIMTDTNGMFSLRVPSREVKVRLSRSKYVATDTVLKLNYNTPYITLNLGLNKHVNQNIIKLSGYDVTINKQVSPTYDSSYIISGILKLKSNEIFKADSGYQTLHFTNVKVIASENGLSYPIEDSVVFDEILLKGKAYGFAPIEISNPILRQYEFLNTSYRRFSEGVIKGNVLFKMSTLKSFYPKFALNVADAKINYSSSNTNNNLITYFSPGVDSSRIFPINKKFFVHFTNLPAATATSLPAPITGNYFENQILTDYKIFIQKDSCVLNGDGMTLAGYLKLPSFIFQPNTAGAELLKINFKNTVVLNKNFEFQDWTSETIASAESVVKLKRLYAKLENLKLNDIGTENAEIDFSGQMSFFKEDFNVALRPWRIKDFNIKNSTAGLIAGLSITPPVKNFYLNGLSFAPKERTDLSLSFIKADSSFSFSIAGKVDFVSSSLGNKGSALSKIFPLDIETFQYNSKNGSMLMAAKPNMQFNFDIVKITLSKFAINVGSAVTINDMLALVDDTVAAKKNFNSILNETPSSKWAVSLKGLVDFQNIKGFSGNSDVSLAFGMFNDEFQFAVSQVGLKLKNPSFQLEARLGLKLYGDTLGFKGAARIDILEQTWAGSLGYYKIKNKDVYLAAGFTAPLNPMVVTHPIQWYAYGGGFEYSSKEPMFYVGVNGQFGPVGTIKKEGYIDSAYLGILFNSENDCGIKPTIKGGGTIILKDKKWGYATADLDFCNLSTLLNVHLDVPDIIPNVKAKLDGILYAVAPQIGDVAGRGMFFFDVNADVNISNAVRITNLLAIGINYNNDKDFVPDIVKNAFAEISDVVKSDIAGRSKIGFNGFLIDGSITLAEQSGSYTLWPFSASYRIYASANRKFWYNYNSNNLGMRIALEGEASGSISAERVASISGRAAISAILLGGYNGSKWYFNGDFNTSLEIYNDVNVGCNRIDLSWSEACWNWSYPCGVYWFGVDFCDARTCIPYISGVGFKGCMSLNVNTSWTEGEAVKFNINH